MLFLHCFYDYEISYPYRKTLRYFGVLEEEKGRQLYKWARIASQHQSPKIAISYVRSIES